MDQTFTIKFEDGRRATVTASTEDAAVSQFDDDKTHGDIRDIFPRV